MTRIGVILCENRSLTCAGLNCLEAIAAHDEAFARYTDEIKIVGFTTCGGCPGNLAKKKAESMIKYSGAEKIHLSSCVFRSMPNPNEPLQDIETKLSQLPWTQFNRDDYVAELAKSVKSGQLPHVCPFREKIKKDIEMLGVEVIARTHGRLVEIERKSKE